MTLTTERQIRHKTRKSLQGALARARAVWRQRRRLEKLDDAALKDIGVSRSEAMREARRPFWDAPETWRW
ncbi:MAG: DUF1127 domain-containing protein [Paracoccaceae bacterium]